jgi:multiple sugar transport system substrate-binding protein
VSRRHFLGGLAGSAVAALLASCGSGAGTSTAPAGGGGGAAATSTTAPPPTRAATGATSPAGNAGAAAGSFPTPTVLKASGNVTLEFWFGEPPETGPVDLANAFMQRYPNIKVNPTRYVNDDTGNTKLDTALQGGTPIDVYMSYGVPRTSKRIQAGAAEDLTPYISADPAVKAWVDATTGIFKYEGRYFSLPTVSAPNHVIANKKVLDAAGVTLPTAWTMEEFRALARQLSTGSGSKQVYGAYEPPPVATMILGANAWYKNNGTESNFDHPAFRQGLELHRSMIEEKSAFPWTEVLAQNLRVYQQNVFLTDQVGLWVNTSFVLRYVGDLEKYPHDFVTTFAPLPKPTGVDQYFNSPGLVNDVLLNPKTKNKDAAWAFLRFRLTDGAQYMLKSGKAPAFSGTDPDVIVDSILGPKKDQLYDVAAYKQATFDPNINYYTDTITTASAQITQIVQQQSDRYLIGEITLDQWVETVKGQADAAIRQARG